MIPASAPSPRGNASNGQDLGSCVSDLEKKETEILSGCWVLSVTGSVTEGLSVVQ